jgi:hypothetical protein
MPLPAPTDFSPSFGATTEDNEPLPCGMAGETLWYSYDSHDGGKRTADTDGSSLDTVLAVYSGSGLGDLKLLACNDDSHDVRSSADFDAQPGVTYHFQIGLSSKGRALTEGDFIRFHLK